MGRGSGHSLLNGYSLILKPMLTLHHSPISTCSQKVRLCLAEKGLAFESRIIDFGKLEHLSDEYLAINPNGVVPTLVHDGRPVIDSSVICEYIEEVWPDHPLSPGDAFGRAAMRAWMRYLEEVPTAAIRVPSYNRLFVKSLAKLSEQAFARMTNKMPLRKAFYRKMQGEAGFSRELYDESIDKLESTLARAEKALAASKWLVGDRFTIADSVLAPTVVRMDDIGLADIWRDKPNVGRWYEAVCARPSFAVAYFPGSRVDPATFNLSISG